MTMRCGRPRLGRLLLAAALSALFACKADPFDEAAIRKDFQKRSPKDVDQEAAKISFSEPAHGRLTEGQIAGLLRWEQLRTRMFEVLNADYKAGTDAAMKENSRTSRLGLMATELGAEAFSKTMNERAALTLGLNPGELEWIRKEVGTAQYRLKEARRIDDTLAKRKADFDATNDRALAAYYEALYNDTLKEKQAWDSAIGPAESANMAIVKRHLKEIQDVYAKVKY